MRVLAVETSTLMGSVGVVDDDRVMCELTLHVEETHSAQIMPAIDYVLRTVKLTVNQLDGLAIALGPGSFTGLRIGMATVKGLAVAAEKPIAGVSTLEAMASGFPFCPYPICPLLDARMKEVYAAWFKAEAGKVVRESEDLVLPISELLQGVREDVLFFGSGAQRYKGQIVEMMGTSAHFISPEIEGARASLVGFLAVEKLKRGDVADIDALEPLYIRESQAIMKRQSQKKSE
jgi:tRNA threonylcarbamoyladenosine biosynthesis protein TsaB